MNRRKQDRAKMQQLLDDQDHKTWAAMLARQELDDQARQANREAWALAAKYLLLRIRHRKRMARLQHPACAAKNRRQARSRLLASPRDRREE